MREINNLILKLAPRHIAQAFAPSTIPELLNGPKQVLTVWDGASDNTIFDCPQVNHAFRALHDAAHIETRLGFTVAEEIELGRIQAARIEARHGRFFADLVWVEVAEQAKHYETTGNFVSNQVKFTLDAMEKIGHAIK